MRWLLLVTLIGCQHHSHGTASDAAIGDGTSVDARSVDAAPAAIPNHFPSASYAYQYNAWMTADPLDVRYYLTFAEVPFAKRAVCGNTFGEDDCFGLYYMNTDKLYFAAPSAPSSCSGVQDGSTYGTLPETSFAHAPGTTAIAANRVRGYYATRNGCAVLAYGGVPSDASPGGVIDHWKSWLAARDDGALGGFFHDDLGAFVSYGYYPGGFCPPFTGTAGAGTTLCASTREFPDVAALNTARGTFFEAMVRPHGGTMPELYNGCPAPGGGTFYLGGTQLEENSFAVDPRVRAIALGCEAEGTLSASVPVRVNQIAGTGVYAKNVPALLDNISAVADPAFSYVLLDYGDPDATLRRNERAFDLGVAWLAYQPGTRNVVQFDDFNYDSSDLEFFPEQLLVPWDPVQTMQPYDVTNASHGEHDLRVDLFAYVDSLSRHAEAPLYCREFRSLYEGHRRTDNLPPTRLGRGAVCVNTSDAARPILASYLTQTYDRVITLPATSIADPASAVDVSTAFVVGQTQVAAGGAIFLLGH